ncbi:MAG: RIP metalloprotease RseP [Firmicutes bacterium]|nr:RIP metalloprotease RseP [Bacillota bacterium]
MIFMTIIYFILILGITVMVHEFGHFLFAKKAGVHVYEFSIGMGPRLFKWNRKNDETEYSIRLFPIGGYVQMAGESNEDEDKLPKEKLMQSKTWWQRFLIIIAGIMFNFIMAIIILFFIALFNGSPKPNAYIGSLEENYPAYSSGFRIGDEIVKVNGEKVSSSDILLLKLEVNKGKEVTFTLKHENGTLEDIKIKPKLVEVDGVKGYKYGFGLTNEVETGLISAIKYAFVKTFNLIHQMVLIIWYLCTGVLSLNTLSGPIGIFTVVGETAKTGFVNLIFLLAFISINVGFMNLLPIPAFDGGRLLFLIIEKIKGSPINSKVENIIHSIGFILLMLLMIVITYNDIIRTFIK